MQAEPRTYPHGVPSWVDLEPPDVDAALAFYGELFDWAFTEKLPPGAPGRYVVASLDGTDDTAVAAIASDDGRPGSGGWNTYTAVDDVDAVTARVDGLRGELLSGPETVGPPGAPAGRTAALRDPDGAVSRLWQAGTRVGAQSVDGPRTWVLSVLRTPDQERALAFYGPLLSWERTDELGAGMVRVPGYGDHLASTCDPDIHERQAFAPPGFADVVAGMEADDGPARWVVVFAVEDRDAAAEAAERAGGTVLSTSENRWTRDAEVRDPQGALLVLSQFAPQDAG